MTNTNPENIESHSESNSEKNLTDDQVKPKPIGRPRTAFWRYREDGTYNHHPISPTHYHDYHIAHFEPVECPHCRQSMNKRKLNKHIETSKRCLKVQNSNKNL